MKYPEFEHLKNIKDAKNPFSELFEYETGERFYIEPAFYGQLMTLKEQHGDKIDIVLKKMEEVVKKNKKVIFTANFEYPQTEAEGYIVLEIFDITNPLQIYVEDKGNPDTGWKD